MASVLPQCHSFFFVFQIDLNPDENKTLTEVNEHNYKNRINFIVIRDLSLSFYDFHNTLTMSVQDRVSVSWDNW